jgi:hypothetical protein
MRAGIGGAAARQKKRLIPTVILYDRWYNRSFLVLFFKKEPLAYSAAMVAFLRA